MTREATHRMKAVAQKQVEAGLARIEAHPFIAGALAQTLTQSQAQRWIKCAGRESRSFPQILENMVKRCSNSRIGEILTANLNDEHGNGDPEQAHFQHYLHLLDTIGLPRDDFYQYSERAGIKLALSLAYSISTQDDEAVALGYMLINEGMTGLIYSAVQTALRRYYPSLETPFFALHTEVDIRHVEELYTAVLELRAESLPSLLFGIQVGERGMAVLLDEALGVFDGDTGAPVFNQAA